MNRSEHFNVSAVKCLNVYPLSVNGHKYVISVVAKDIVCEYSDLMIGSSPIFVEASRLFVDEQSHPELYVVNKGDEWRSYWVEASYVSGVRTYYFVDAFTDVSGVFTVVFSYLCGDGKTVSCS